MIHIRFFITLLLVLALGVVTATAPRTAQAQKASSKISSHLKQLHDDYQQGKSLQRAPSKSGGLVSAPDLPIANGKILIDAVAAGTLAQLTNDLAALGHDETGVYGKVASGWFPVEDIDALEGLESLQFARISYRSTSVGLVTSQGDAAMRTDDVRTTFGLDGTDLTVGILSDTFDDFNGVPLTTYADDVASGDLPAGVNILDDTGGPGIDEGRAMAQLIYDAAPGVDLAFHTAFTGQAGFAQGILDLAAAGSDVIVDDVIYFAEPMFQDGPIAQAADAVAEAGIPYFSSAGNQARASYEGPFVSSGISIDYGAGPAVAHDFDPGPGVDIFQQVTFPGGNIPLTLQWDNPFFSVSGGSGAQTDLDLCFFSADGSTLFFCTADANIGGDPVEVEIPSTAGPFTASIAIFNFSGPDPGLMKYVALNSSFSIDEYATNSSSSYGHANAAGAEAVGAARYDATPAFGTNPPEIEFFSSAGGTPILFETDGTRKASPEVRLKPGITAPDGTNTTFFGSDYEGDGFPNFFGTSAAAPHAAAAAALILQDSPTLTTQQVYEALRTTAIDMDDPFTAGFDTGFDFGTGFGLIDAFAAVNAAKSSVDECTPATLVEGAPYVGGDGIGRIDLTFSTPDGITEVDFTLWNVTYLDNLEVESSMPASSSPPDLTFSPAANTVKVTLKQVDPNIDEASYFATASSLCPTAPEGVLSVEFDPPVDMPLVLPERFALDAAYPNPARGPATIGYALPEASNVTLAVYDVLGRRVATLVDGAQPAGQHEVTLDTERLPSGMYVYRLTAGQQVQSRRLLLVK